MKTKKQFSFWVKAFLSSAAFPSIIFTLFVGILRHFYVITFFWWVPFAFGSWNLLYFATLPLTKKLLPNRVIRLLISGALLGLTLSIATIFVLKRVYFSTFIKILSIPLISALIWRYATAYFNKNFGLND